MWCKRHTVYWYIDAIGWMCVSCVSSESTNMLIDWLCITYKAITFSTQNTHAHNTKATMYIQNVHARIHIPTYVHTYIHAYEQIHSCMYTYMHTNIHMCNKVISLGGYICSHTILFSFSPDKLIATSLFICLFICHVCDYANKDYIYFPKSSLQTRKFLLAWNSMLVCYNVIIAGCWQTEWCLSQKGNYSLWRFVCLLCTCGASAVPCMSD